MKVKRFSGKRIITFIANEYEIPLTDKGSPKKYKKMHLERTHRTLQVISLIYVHSTRTTTHIHYRTIEIGNIFADNTVTETEGTRELHCVHTNRKMAPSKLQNVPKIH